MTSTSTPPDDDLPRDPAFDDAWRALSAEEPPPAIDAALRAAARREVDAGPRIAVADRIATPRATKAVNWWRPLAVAATLGAIAVGLVQLIAPERIGAPGHDGAVISDMPTPPPAGRSESANKQAIDATSRAAAPADEKAAMPQAPAAPAPRGADRKDAAPPAEPPASASGGLARKEPQSREVASAFPSAAPADKRQQETRKDSVTERKRDAGEYAAPASPAANAEAPAPAPARSAERAAAPAVAPTRAAEPFPADRGDATAKREAADASVARAPAAAGAVSPSTTQGAADKPAATQPAPENSTSPLAKLKAAPAQAANEPGAAPTDGASPRREQDAQSRVPAPSASLAAAPAGKADALAGAHPALAVPDWIALIRRLIAERNFAAADKELAAFRAAHADAQRLLPPDLRDWKPPR